MYIIIVKITYCNVHIQRYVIHLHETILYLQYKVSLNCVLGDCTSNWLRISSKMLHNIRPERTPAWKHTRNKNPDVCDSTICFEFLMAVNISRTTEVFLFVELNFESKGSRTSHCERLCGTRVVSLAPRVVASTSFDHFSRSLEKCRY